MSNCAVLIPIYKESLDADEEFSVSKSLSNLQGHDIYWIAPLSLDLTYYHKHFKGVLVKRFDNAYFESIAGYNKLLVTKNIYVAFEEYEYVLICQPDAIVLKPDLVKWTQKPYDYIGAPWPNGYALTIAIKSIPILEGVKCNAFVGNGGLSLRRNKACIRLIEEFSSVSEEWAKFGHAEDLFFAFMGTLSEDFMLPNFMTAAHFSHDIDPIYLQKIIGYEIPFGVHAWKKYEKDYWHSKFI
jgi:hypothetical protein